ncbi:MAG: asparaginase [Clostridia bacterium]|nr:asparaginase [Clostridia bacterium]
MKNILLIATGGTIASKPTEAGMAPVLDAEELLSCVPEIAGLCRVDKLQPFNLDSTNVCAKHWLEIARLIEANYEKYDGFVVTHGTDTMAYTAAAVSYLVQNSPKPVVFTGSQRSAYMRDTDARRNLADAFTYCADDGASGVHIVFDGSVILGTRAKKTRTRSYNAFSSIDYPDVAVMRDGKPVYYIREKVSGKPKFFHELNENVFVLKLTPGLKSDIFDYLDKSCDGLIIESFGSGGLPDYGDNALFGRLKAFREKGKTVVFTTQVEREGSSLFTYEVGRKLHELGVLEARCMTLEATVAKLMWALSLKHGRDAEELFLHPIGRDILE